MTEFSAILAQLEASERHLDSPTHMRRASIVIDSAADEARRTKTSKSRIEWATTAYGQAHSEWQGKNAGAPRGSVEPAPPSDLKSLLEELRLARGSIERLRSVRRRLAWICHPDRRPSASGSHAEKLMAELNARIDAAIAEVARRPVGKTSRGDERGFRPPRR